MTRIAPFIYLVLLLASAACGGDDPSLVPGMDAFELKARSRYCSGTMDSMNDGTIDQRWSFDYQDDGLRQIEKSTDAAGNVIEVYVITFNRAGKIVSVDLTVDGNRSVTSHVYDSAGRLVRSEIDNNGDGTPETAVEITAWTDFGKPLATRARNSALGTAWTGAYGYDADGRLTSNVTTSEDGRQLSRRTIVYDDVAGTRTIEWQQLGSGGGSTEVDTFAGGKLVRVRSTYDGGWEQTDTVYRGKTIEETYRASDGGYSVTTFKTGC